MLTHFFILGLSPNATDSEIRGRYLALVKQFPPEKYPNKFKEITDSYEQIKDKRTRIESKIFGVRECNDIEAALLSMLNAVEFKRRRPSLDELVQAVAGL